MKKIMVPFFVLALFFTSFVSAELVLDSIQFDPAIISSGDEVDIVVQFHDKVYSASDSMSGDLDYKFKVLLEPDDTLTKEFVIIQDAEGDDLAGIIYSGQHYNKKFRVKIMDNAPAGNYEFKLIGKWYYKDEPLDVSEYLRFMMPVKKEGVSLSISNVISDPERVRSGDKNILLKAGIYNSGEKPAKNVRVSFSYPNGISSSYTNNNEMNVGVIEKMQKKDILFYLDTDKNLKSGIYRINYTINYQDFDSNTYSISSSFPFVVKKKPNIIVLNSTGLGKAGDEVELKVYLKNIGEEKADAVDVRIIKQSSQPFEMDVRSSYIGQLKPGETAVAVFNLNVNRDAEIKEHGLNLAIRAKGDSEEGDSNIYTYAGKATVDVTGITENNYPMYAAIFLVLVVLSIIIYYVTKKK
jgi:hypothetical protein